MQIVPDDFPSIREVDLKLLELAKKWEAKVVTNDFNLNKVAHLHHVEVLNINDLANALKPVVLPGEHMNVLILKEGKEYNQGVGYLDDGTMVVVDHARKLIGRSVEISVTSVLQTASGKMIFGKMDENGKQAEASRERPGAGGSGASLTTCRRGSTAFGPEAARGMALPTCRNYHLTSTARGPLLEREPNIWRRLLWQAMRAERELGLQALDVRLPLHFRPLRARRSNSDTNRCGVKSAANRCARRTPSNFPPMRSMAPASAGCARRCAGRRAAPARSQRRA